MNSMVATSVTFDRQAVLLLCCAFGQLGSDAVQPLSISEYNHLAKRLKRDNLRPGNLLQSPPQTFWQDPQLDRKRIEALLNRGGLMGIVLERWQAQGVWMICRFEENYPVRLKQRLGDTAPPILYGVGNQSLLHKGGLGIVGSRHADQDALDYTQRVAATCARDGWPVISGGAKGVDRVAMLGALDAGGQAIGVMADPLLKAAVTQQYRAGLQQGSLALISSFDPEARWLVSRAMQRNKYIYCLADAVLVVSSQTDGGTWQGATEALKHYPTWQVPVFVRSEEEPRSGNTQLLTQGGIPFPSSPWLQPFPELLRKCKADPPQPAPASTLDPCQLNLLANDKQDSLETVSLAPQSAPARDVYALVLPLILDELQQPKGLKELAASLHIQERQAKVWVERAVTEGHLRVVQKKYVVAS